MQLMKKNPSRGSARPPGAPSHLFHHARRSILHAPLAAALLAFRMSASAQDTSPFRDLDRYVLDYTHPGSQLKDHIYERSRRFFATGDARRDAIRTVDEVRQRQEEIRRVVLASFGGLPSATMPSAKTPLNPR